MQKTKIAIADDHSLVREVTAAYLRAQLDAEVMQAGEVRELEDLILAHGPFDLVLLDLVMPGMNHAAGALGTIIEANQRRPVVLLSGNAAPNIVADAISMGAAGYIEKTQTARSLVNAINFILAGEIYLPTSFRLQATRQTGEGRGLTRKEIEVLRSLTSGLMNKEIALNMGLSEVTVKMHVRSICAKLNVKNRTQAALMAAQYLFGADEQFPAHDPEEVPLRR